jgi:glycine/D-amino acid oxidase-like deaminating enzyme
MAPIDPIVLSSLADLQPSLYWLDADPLEPESHSALVGDVITDLCIVGAGYTGLWTALLAKERNPKREVVIIEQRETGNGASGRNGGFCNASLTHGFVNGYTRFADEMAVIEKLGRDNLNQIEATINKYNIDCDFERTGELRVAVAPWQLDGLKEEAIARNNTGDHVEVLSKEQIRKRVNSPLYEGALHDADGTALVDPARLVWGLEKVCLSLGVKIYENSKVEELIDEDSHVVLKTAYGQVRAKKVALATNIYSPLVKSARKYVIAVYDFQLVTQPLTNEQLESIGWKGREGLSDAGYQFHYYRLTKENEILWGGYDAIYNYKGKVRQEYEARPETYAKLATNFFRTFPQLAGIKFTHGWGGAIDTCSRFSPFWGTDFDNKLAYVLGYTGLGVASTRFGASTMLDLLDGIENEATNLQMVKHKPIPFPPEPFRFLFIRLTQWSINKADQNKGKRNLWLRLLDRLGLGFDS